MPTPAERKALAFLASVAIAGAAARATGAASRAQTADAASREALRRQVVAVESAGAADRRGRGRARDKGAQSERLAREAATPAPPLDVDAATAQSLERLPRIGPALAQRIVHDRAMGGAFGSLDGLQRVRGIGPAMARELAPYVTFSGTPRPSIAGEFGASAVKEGTRKSRVTTGAAPERRKRRPVPP